MSIPEALIDWLLENAGAIVRWRTATELCVGISTMQQELLRHELIANPWVREWLERLNLDGLGVALDTLDETSLGRLGGRVHGSKLTCLENVLGKLAEFGLQAGMLELDQRAIPLMRIFRWRSEWQSDITYRNAWETSAKSVFAWGLLRLGYAPDAAMEDFLIKHLQDCHKIARDRIYDLYADEKELNGLPKAWVGKPIIKQEVMADYWLPYIHDLYIFANFPTRLQTEENRGMIADLVSYILDPRFQALREGYGYAWIKERRTCYSWGWSPHLPGFKDFDSLPNGRVTPLLTRLELMARLPRGRESGWLRDALAHLEGFRTQEGLYHFPGNYLHEAEGYYVSGYGMGLGENRRTTKGIVTESTFRMLSIKRKIGEA